MKNLKKFISDAIIELNKYKFTIQLEYTKKVIFNEDDPEPVEAIFSEFNRVIKIATKYPFKYWAQFFLHEYCHFLQFLEHDITLCRFNKASGIYDASSILTSWLKGKDFKRELIEKCIRLTQELELNCEKRAVRLIRNRKLEIDESEYIKTSNCYILFYEFMFQERKWYKRYPCEVKELVSMMPNYFLKRFDKYNSLYENYSKIIKRKCL